MLVKLFFTLKMLIFSIAFLLNCVGILLTCLNPKGTNQNAVLFYLSSTENIFILFTSIFEIDRRFWMLSRLGRDIIIGIHLTFSAIQFVLVMYVLTFDRLIFVINPLKYKLRVTKTKIRISIFITCIISIPIVTIYRIFDNFYFYTLALTIVGFGYLLVAMTTYMVVFYVLKKSNERFNAPSSTRDSMKKKFLVPRIIIFTFLLLYFIPLFIYGFSFKKRGINYSVHIRRHSTRDSILETLVSLGLIADPLTYIFLSKHYRAIFFNFCQKHRLSNNMRNDT